MNNIIIRLSPGLANAIMEFCAGYALARRLGEQYEIVLDIGEMQQAASDYLLDHFNIPLYKKITYNVTDVYETGHTNKNSMPIELLEGRVFVTKDRYTSIDDFNEIAKSGEDIILADFFFDPHRYYIQYWDEVKKLFAPREKDRNIEEFMNLIAGKVSVGVHFRRGDMLYSKGIDFMTDEYYKGAIEYCRKKFGNNTLFCVFSDDIEYAQNTLGYSDNVRYIHFIDGNIADFEEFVCLSLCDHRILSNNSTYSILADRINGNENRVTIFQGDLKKDKSYKIITKILKKYISVLMPKKKSKNSSESNFVYLDRRDIDRYSKRYKKSEHDELEYMLKLRNLTDSELTINNIQSIMNELTMLGLNFVHMDKDLSIKIECLKLKAYCMLGDYEKGISLADEIWGYAIENELFRELYSELLKHYGQVKEAKNLLEAPFSKTKILVFPGAKGQYYGKMCGMGELATCFAKMGGNVSVILDLSDEKDIRFTKDHKYLTTSRGDNRACRQYLYEDIINSGIDSFIDRMISEENDGKKGIIISRVPKVFENKNSKAIYIFIDFSDEQDPERNYKNYLLEYEIEKMIMQADVIMTSDVSLYNNRHVPGRIIEYNKDGTQYPFWEVNGWWELHDNSRLSCRTQNIFEAITRDFKETRREGI